MDCFCARSLWQRSWGSVGGRGQPRASFLATARDRSSRPTLHHGRANDYRPARSPTAIGNKLPMTRGKRAWADGPPNWRKRAALFLAWTSTVLLALLICLGLSFARGAIGGSAELYSGPCSRAKNANRALQAALALVAIGLSVSFDFFMRLASSPTIEDLGRAHSQGRSLDIGVQSWRNIRQASWSRRLSWAFLALAAAPLQLFLHSTTFVIFSQTDYTQFIVSPAFTTGGAFAYPGVAFAGTSAFNASSGVRSYFDHVLPSFRSAPGQWERLPAGDCMYQYLQDPNGLQRRRDLLLVVKAKAEGWRGADVWNNTTPRAYPSHAAHEYNPMAFNSLWWFAVRCYQDRVGSDDGRLSTFCCPSFDCYADDDSYNGWRPSYFLSLRASKSFWEGFLLTGLVPDHMDPALGSFTVDYCLSEPYVAPCKLAASTPILLINLACVLVGFASCSLIAYVCWNDESCQSLGDAIQALMGSSDLVFKAAASTDAEPSSVIRWKETRKRWGHVVGRSMWFCTYVPIGLVLVGGSVVFVQFGAPAFPSLYSMLFQGKYWAGFSVRPQRLRVSFPHREQQATYALQCPLVWGLVFVTFKATLGWLLTQALYIVPLAYVSRQKPNINLAGADICMYFGYSVKAMLATLLTGAGAASMPILLCFRPLPRGSLIVATDSAAIAAFCPPAPTEAGPRAALPSQHETMAAWDKAWGARRLLRPLRWGVLKYSGVIDQRPDVLGLGTEDEVLTQPVDGHTYIAVSACKTGDTVE
ncbi:hypothetical protein CDD83_11242 [Cordyceps sp. RAO-2017]|nr:hypothetical protein CDD83_11242 [Cordyceps sp. RAO-2017]